MPRSTQNATDRSNDLSLLLVLRLAVPECSVLFLNSDRSRADIPHAFVDNACRSCRARPSSWAATYCVADARRTL